MSIEYNLPKGESAEEWVSKNWETLEEEFYLKNQDDETMYHFFPTFDSLKEIFKIFEPSDDTEKLYYIFAPVGEDTENGNIDTWYIYNSEGNELFFLYE